MSQVRRRRQRSVAAILVVVGGLRCGGDATGPGGVAFQNLSAGLRHTCGIGAGGVGYCWGTNTSGRLGTGDTTRRSDPAGTVGGVRFTSVSGGGFHSCGLTAAGAAYCWGDNSLGQLGVGTDTTDRATPTLVAGTLAFRSVSAGYLHTCGVATTGAAYCWGYNFFGQLGDGTGAGQFTPKAVSGGASFSSLSAGLLHTCGVVAADSTARCWGSNSAGQLGIGGGPSQFTPTPVAGGRRFSVVGAGGGHTCGIVASGSRDIYCWGENESGQLGVGDTTDRFVPVEITGGLAFASLAVGGAFTCGIASSSAAYCWGDNSLGQLGNGGTADQWGPALVTGGLSFVALVAGGAHNCGIAGVAYCWGFNDSGQLGDGTRNGSLVPVRVTGQANPK